jgi:beta-galactosidase
MLHNGLIRLWENPEVTQLNKLPGRASFESYPSAALARARRRNPWKIDLDGEWDFFSAPDIVTGLGIACATSEKTQWTKITVPGHPEFQGHGKPHYTNAQMPFSEEPPRVPTHNPTGIFRRSIKIPGGWKSRRIVLHFGSAESLLAVWVNGEAVGMSKGSRLPAEFDITALACAGREMEITALVAKWSDSNFIEDQDMWWLSGLPRSVALFAMPRTHIADVNLRPVINGKAAELEAEVRVGCDFPAPESVTVELQLLDPEGRAVFSRPLREKISWQRQGLAEKRGLALFRAKVPRCRLWTAETPSLYTALISLKGDGPESHTAVRTGFRSVEIRGGDLLVNGRRVLIFGVNRHSHDDLHGRAVPRERMLEDVRLMKKFHFNAVRCSHYPPDPYWLELCDEYGLYVIDEADAESHDFHNALCRDPRYAAAWLDRAMRMVQRDRNHPSILLWSLGNESGYGPNHDAAAGWIRHSDPSRPLHYEGAISLYQSRLSFLHGQAVTDVICPMYTDIENLRAMDAFLSEAAPQEPSADPELLAKACLAVPPATGERPIPPLRQVPHPAARPIILCEYSHAMGNSNGSLHDYFALFRSAKHIQGGFIWEWADHGIRQKTEDGCIYWAYGGDFGDVPNDANFVCDGLVGPDRDLHPAMHEHRHLAQPVWISAQPRKPGFFLIENRQDFLSTDWLGAEWRFLRDGVPVRKGRLTIPKIAPGQAARVNIPAGDFPQEGELLFDVRFFSKKPHGFFAKGETVGFNQIPLGPAPVRKKRTASAKEQKAVITREGGHLLLRAGALVLKFDEKEARLDSVSRGGRTIFFGGPTLALWRAATDNDGIKLWIGQDAKPLGRWLALGLDRLEERPAGTVISPTDSGSVRVVLRRQASGRKKWNDAAFESAFEVLEDGEILIKHFVSFGAKEMTDLPRVGCAWIAAPEFQRLKYYGRGPHENYADRKTSALLGIYESTVSAQYVPYVMPQENGHHCETRWLELSSESSAILVEPGEPLGFDVSHFTAADLFSARHTIDLKARPEVYLTLDAAHRGVGTGSCGPDTRPEYQVKGTEFRWEYRIRIR